MDSNEIRIWSSDNTGPIQPPTTDTVTIPVGNHGSWTNQIWINPPTLSSQEDKELERLQCEREEATRELRKAAFRALPKELRQFIIDSNKALEVCRKIRETRAAKTARERELDSKHFNYWGDSPDMSGLSLDPFADIALDSGLSMEDMESAHADACLEEILLEKGNTKFNYDHDDGVWGC